MIFSVLLGSGKRLFGKGTVPRSKKMVEHRVTARGTVIATFEPAGEVDTSSFITIEPSPAELARRQKMAHGTR